MQAYHPEASRNLRNQPAMQDPYMMTMLKGSSVVHNHYNAAIINMAPQRIAPSAPKRLDAWTLYELTKEKQKMHVASKAAACNGSGKASIQVATPATLADKNLISKTTEKPKRNSGRRDPTTERRDSPEQGSSSSTSRRRQSSVLPLGGTYNDSKVDQLIATAKSKRNSLLSEVTLKLNEEECNIAQEELGDSIASLPDILANNRDEKSKTKGDKKKKKKKGTKGRKKKQKKGSLDFDFLKEDDDFHSSCFF